jgi:hypothetical protein
MKKIALTVALMLLGAFAYSATNIVAITGNREDRWLRELVDHMTGLADSTMQVPLAEKAGALLSATGSTITNGTTITEMAIIPNASSARNALALGQTHRLIRIGYPGLTYWGFGDTSNRSFGVSMFVGRQMANPATANFSGFDTGFEFTTINGATNNAAYNLRGGYIKAKNYTGGTVGSLQGLIIETTASGTDAAGESCILGFTTDSTVVDYGITFQPHETGAGSPVCDIGTADIQFHHGGLILNSDATTLQITEAVVDVIGQPRDDGKALVCAPSTATWILDKGTGTIQPDGTTTGTFTSAFAGGTVPSVCATYTDAVATQLCLYVTAVASNTFKVTGNPTNGFNWIAVGVR